MSLRWEVLALAELVGGILINARGKDDLHR